MNKKNLIYQKAVDTEANKLLILTQQQFEEFEDYGSFTISIDNSEVPISWSHYKMNEYLHYIVYITERRVIPFIPLYNKFINGAKLENGNISLFTNKEIGIFN